MPKGNTAKKEVPIVYPFPMLPKPVDKAVDGIHSGPVTHQNYARFIINTSDGNNLEYDRKNGE